METFAHPEDYACVFAGVPVSDLVQRMGYLDKDYGTTSPPRTTSARR